MLGCNALEGSPTQLITGKVRQFATPHDRTPNTTQIWISGQDPAIVGNVLL